MLAQHFGVCKKGTEKKVIEKQPEISVMTERKANSGSQDISTTKNDPPKPPDPPDSKVKSKA